MKPQRGGGRPSKYLTSDGKRVPGVTTITSRFKDSAALLIWANRQGLEGKSLNEARDAAADVGHIAHGWCEEMFHGLPPSPVNAPEEHLERARVALAACSTWRDQTRAEVVETETPLVSDEHRFGGTLDMVLRINGDLWLGDLKTSNGIYPEMLTQLGGYSVLLNERGTPVTGMLLLRLGKEHADFHTHTWPRSVLDRAEEAFLLARRMYDIDKELKGLAR